MELPFDCGCDNRRDVMSAGDWYTDAIMVGVAVLVVAIVYAVTK